MSQGYAVVVIAQDALPAEAQCGSSMACYEAAMQVARPLARLAAEGTRVVVCCDSTPLLDETLTQGLEAMSRGWMVEVDQTLGLVQGRLGYSLVQALDNESRILGSGARALSMGVRSRVDLGHPSFMNPSAAVGPLLPPETAQELRDMEGWTFREEAEGWQRLVAAPPPLEVVETEILRSLLDKGLVPVVCGGGIPVVHDERALLMGVCALVDVRATARLLAQSLEARLCTLVWDADATEWQLAPFENK